MPDPSVPAMEQIVAAIQLPDVGNGLRGAGAAFEIAVTPMNAGIQRPSDAGRPPLAADPEGPVARRYREIARRLGAETARRPSAQRHRIGKIVVETR